MNNKLPALLSSLLLLPLPSIVAQPTTGSLNSGLRIHETGTGPGDFAAEWFGVDGYYYFPQQSMDLVNWSWVGNYGAGNDNVLGFSFSTNADRLFLRLRYSDDPNSDLLSADFSGTRLSNWDTIQLGYDPFLWEDTLENGLPDVWEIFYFGALGVNPQADASGDGITNRDNYDLALDPTEDHTGQAMSYTYDPIGRLIAVSGNATSIDYVLDPEGNITQAQ